MFTSSCVQVDLLDDLYDDSELFCPPRKRAKQDPNLNFVDPQPYYNWTCSFSVVAYISEGDMYRTYTKLIDDYIKNNMGVITAMDPSITQYHTRDRAYCCGLMFGTDAPSGRGLSDDEMCSKLGYKKVSVSSFSGAQTKYDKVRNQDSKCKIVVIGKNAEGRHSAILKSFKITKKDGLKINTYNPGGTASELESVQYLLIPSSINL